MAYNTPPTKNVGDTFTAAEFNTYIRDNFEAGAPGVFTTKGDLLVATGSKAGSRLAKGTDGFQLVADSSQPTGLVWLTRRWTVGQWTNGSWDGDAKSVGTTTITVNTFNAGVPNAALAVWVWVSIKATSAGALLRCSYVGQTQYFVAVRTQSPNTLIDATGLVHLNGSGQFDVIVSANLSEAYLEIGAYLL